MNRPTTWLPANLPPEKNKVVVVLERGKPYLAWLTNDNFWIERDRDGAAFNRDGSISYLDPEWWAPLPKGET